MISRRNLIYRGLVFGKGYSAVSRHHFCILKTLNSPKPKGKLSIIPTPIGNLNDLTPNILKCLFTADLIGCEDRRVAGQLYTLIRNKSIIEKMEEQFGSLGLTDLIPYLDDTSPEFNIG